MKIVQKTLLAFCLIYSLPMMAMQTVGFINLRNIVLAEIAESGLSQRLLERSESVATTVTCSDFGFDEHNSVVSNLSDDNHGDSFDSTILRSDDGHDDNQNFIQSSLLGFVQDARYLHESPFTDIPEHEKESNNSQNISERVNGSPETALLSVSSSFLSSNVVYESLPTDNNQSKKSCKDYCIIS